MTLAVRGTLALAIGAAVVVAAAAQPQTVAPSQSTVAFSGKALFSTYCSTCHGVAAKGDGPFAKSLRKTPPDLTLLARANRDIFPGERVTRVIDGRDTGVSHGSNDMPVWGDVFSRTRRDNDPASVQLKIKALVQYLETLQAPPASR